MKANKNKSARIISRTGLNISDKKYVVQQKNWLGIWKDLECNKTGNYVTIQFNTIYSAKDYISKLFSKRLEKVIEIYHP